jgi:hypothetical protein
MWDLWWDKVALGQVFSEFFGFPWNRRSLHQLLHNHPHVSSRECTIANVWPQCWDLQGPRGLEQRDLRNLNLGDLKKVPNGGVSPTPQKNTFSRYSLILKTKETYTYPFTTFVQICHIAWHHILGTLICSIYI